LAAVSVICTSTNCSMNNHRKGSKSQNDCHHERIQSSLGWWGKFCTLLFKRMLRDIPAIKTLR
jgi:hypothetical protein